MSLTDSMLMPMIPAGSENRRFHRITVWILPAMALAPVGIWFIKRLDDGSDEALGILALSLAMCLAWRDRHTIQATSRARTCGALVILASVLTIPFLPPMFRAALAIAGVGIWSGIHRQSGLLGLLGLSLPVIASLQFYAGYPMRLAAAGGAVKLLELSGIVVARNGVNIDLAGQLIGVDPACSGVRMLWHALAAAMALSAIHRTSWHVTLAPPVEFSFNGLTLPLEPLPSSPAERAFAKSFPGSLSSHRWGGAQVILRQVTKATRKLHPSRDCLRAAGFETTDSITVRSSCGEWSRFSATRAGERLMVHERIVSEQDGSSWTDVTAWYWSALWHPLNGPWRAETVICQ